MSSYTLPMLKYKSQLDLDSILEELGNFGKFQLKQFGLIFFAVILLCYHSVSYTFTAQNINYRCLIPECEFANSTEYKPTWLEDAVPFKKNIPRKCTRYEIVQNETVTNQQCPANWFDHDSILNCDEYVFEGQHITIVQDFGLYCEENLWKLTLPGTVHNMGQLFSMPFGGILSDRFGRQAVLYYGLLLGSLAGVIRSFSPGYIIFLITEFLDSTFNSVAYIAAFVLGTELISPSYRVLFGVLMFVTSCTTGALAGFTALNILSWRHLLQILYLPSFLIIPYFWIKFESLRWLLTQGRAHEVETIIKKAAKINGVNLSSQTLSALEKNTLENEGVHLYISEKESSPEASFMEVMKHKTMVFRFMNCSLAWFICVFVFYGLTLNSVAIAGNSYVNFIAVALSELPGYFVCYFCLDRFGRRYCLSGSFLAAGASLIAFSFIESDMAVLRLCCYLFGKSSISMTFVIIYVYTIEMFPTGLRQTIMGFCSMFGRFGSILAPQMPLLALIWSSLPTLLYGVLSIIAGSLVLFLPETLHISLPGTLEEAINIGQNEKQKEQK